MRKLILAAGAAVALAAGSAGTALALSGSNAQMLKGTQYFCVNTGSMGSGDGTPQGYKEIRNVPHGCTRGHILTPVVPDPEPTPTPTATATVPVK